MSDRSTQVQIVDSTGEQVSVTGGKLDVNASVTIDTSTLATAANQTNNSQTTQIVNAAGDAVSVTGNKLDVNASIDTTGLATSAKQLPDGHNVALSATDNAVLDDIAANQTDASQKTQIVDGTGNVIGATSNALDVNIKSGASSGTEYDDGDVRGSATGGLMMGDDGTNIQSVHTDASGDLQVDVLSSALPTGASSAANQSTIIGHVDGIETLLGTIDGDTGAIKTAVELLDNAVDGNYLNTNLNLAGVDAPIGAGTEAGVLRVTIANDSTGVVSIDDNGGVITVDGTITANLSATDNAVLDTIDAVLDTINAKLATGTVIGDVNLGATDNAVLDTIDAAIDAINAKMVTGIDIGDVTINNAAGAAAVNIQDGGNAITVDGTVAVTNSDITSCKTALELLDNSVDGNYLNTNMNIAGADVVGGAGAVAAGVQRTTLASDDPAVVSLANIEKSIKGVGSPVVDTYSHVAINLTTGADQVLVSSAASKQIWVYGYGFTCGDADGQTVSLQDEDNTAITGIMEFSQYGGIAVSPSGNFAMPLFKLATNKDLEVDITGGDVDGWLTYAIVSV